jgi:hypothetical protein
MVGFPLVSPPYNLRRCGITHGDLALVGGIGMGMVASFLAASVSRAQAAGEQAEDVEARAIIDKAIKAHGAPTS